jgi:hypothetical protein
LPLNISLQRPDIQTRQIPYEIPDESGFRLGGRMLYYRSLSTARACSTGVPFRGEFSRLPGINPRHRHLGIQEQTAAVGVGGPDQGINIVHDKQLAVQVSAPYREHPKA